MTVTTTTTTNTYTGDGTTTAFSFTFEILETTDIKVIVVTTATGVESVRSIGTGSTNYAVTGTGNVNGGTVTFVTAPTASETVFLMRNMAFTQPTDYRTNDPFPAETHENALDRMALQIQQIGRRLDRALLRPESDTTSGALPHNIDLKGGVLKFNSSSGVPEADSSLTDVATSSANGLMSSSDKAKLDGIEASATTDQTASEILSAIKTVDGASSGLDADLLDGQQGSYYLDASNFSGLGTVATLNVGIGNNNIPKFTSGVSDDDFLKVDGSVIEGRSASEVVSDLGVITADSTTTLTNKTIDASQLSGTVANARLDAQLQDVAGLAVTDGGFIVGDGSNFVLETGATVRTSLGLGTAATLDTGISNTNIPKFTSGVVDDDFLRVDGTAIEGRSASQVLSDIGGQASLTFGISNTNAVKIDSTSVADDEFARFTSSGLESRSASEVLSDIGAQASLTFGISNTNAVKIDSSSVADDEYARFTANGLESRSTSEVLSDIAAMPLAGGTFSNDVTFSDDVKAIFGDGSDLSIRHSGSHSIISDAGTGDLLIAGSQVRLMSSNIAENMLVATTDGAVELYHDNSKKLETTSTGATITGDLTLTSTDSGSGEDPTLKLFRNSSSPTGGDNIGHIQFTGNNASGTEIVLAEIETVLGGTTANSEEGRMRFKVNDGGTETNVIEIGFDRVQFNEAIFINNNKQLTFEGANADAHETSLTATEPTQDNTITLPDASGTVLLNTGDQSITGDLTLISTDAGATENPTLDLYRNSSSPAVNDVIGHITFSGENDAGEKIKYAEIETFIADETDGTEDGSLQIRHIRNGVDTLTYASGFGGNFFYKTVFLHTGVNISFEGATSNANETVLTVTDPTADRTITLPDATGTVALNKGNKVLITETTVSSNTASVDFSSGITDTYTTYVLEFRNLTVTAEANLQMRLGTSGSADSGNNYAQRMAGDGRNLTGTPASITYFSGFNTSSQFQFNDSNEPLTNDSGFSSNGEIVLHNLRSTSHEKTAIAQVLLVVENASNEIEFTTTRVHGMIYRETSAVNFIKLLASGADSGQISGGTVRLYGIE